VSKAITPIMPLMLLVKKAARSSGAVAPLPVKVISTINPQNTKKKTLTIISLNKVKISHGKRTRNQRSNSLRTINSILRMHHLVRTKPIEWKTKGSKIDMTIQPIWDKINIKMRHNNKMVVPDQRLDPAPSLL